MQTFEKWFHFNRLWRGDFDQQRQKAIRFFMAAAIFLGAAFLIVTTLPEGAFLSNHLIVKRVVIILLLLAVVALWRINQLGYKKNVGFAYLVILIIGIISVLPLAALERTFIILGLLTFVASFIVVPWGSFLIATISTCGYSIAYFLNAAHGGYNFFSVIILYITALLSFQIAHRLRMAMNEAGVNETKYFALANSNPAFMYILENGHRGKWAYANPQLTQLLGFEPDEWTNTPGIWEHQLYILDRDRIFAEELRSRREKTPFHAEYRLLSKDERVVWVSDHAVHVPMNGGVQISQGVMLNITQRKRAEQIREATYAISQSAYAADNLDDLFVRIHQILGTLIRAENFFIAMYDDVNDILSFPYFVDEYDQAPKPRPVKQSLTDYVIRTGKPVFASPQVFNDLEREGRVRTTGTPSIDWLGVPLKVKERTIGAMVVQSYHEGERFNQEALDILMFISTQVASAIERKRAEETIRMALDEKEVLVREVHHRVKNNLQVILGLLSLQSDAIDDSRVNEVIQDIRSRISSMALVHQELYQSDDLARVNTSEYFQMLADNLMQVFNKPDVKIVIDASQVLMTVDKAIPCGLILNELMSNAMKYAFPENRPGQVHVFMGEERTAEEVKEIILRVRDDGIGLPEEINVNNPESFGLQIVNILVKQLKGKLTAQNEQGSVFEIRFPA